MEEYEPLDLDWRPEYVSASYLSSWLGEREHLSGLNLPSISSDTLQKDFDRAFIVRVRILEIFTAIPALGDEADSVIGLKKGEIVKSGGGKRPAIHNKCLRTYNKLLQFRVKTITKDVSSTHDIRGQCYRDGESAS